MADKTQRNLETDYLFKRASQLQQFLDGVIESEDLRASLALLCFLKCNKDDQWVKIKEELEKSQTKSSVRKNDQNLRSHFSKKLFEGKNPLQLEDFETLRPEFICKISSELKEYSVHLEDTVKMSQPLYHRLMEQVKTLMGDINSACLTLAKISGTTAELFALHSTFNKSVKSHKWESLTEVYSALNHSVVHWGRHLLWRKLTQEANRYDPESLS